MKEGKNKMMNHYTFLEEIKSDENNNPKQLLWNHYVNCCAVLGHKIDYTYENYFNTLAEERAKEMIEYFNLQSS